MGWKIGDKITVDPKDTDLVLIEQDGNTRNTTLAKLKAFFIGTATLVTTDQTIKGAINEVKSSTDANTTSLSDRTKIDGNIDDTGSANTYVIAPVPPIIAYAKYQTFKFIAKTANTGASTLNVNGLGAKALVKDVNVALTTGDILAGQIITAVYDGTNFQLVPDFKAQFASKPAKADTLCYKGYLAANADFNTILETGYYHIADSSAMTNKGTLQPDWSILEVYITAGGYVKQVITNTPGNVMVMRTRTESSWSAWKTIATADKQQTIYSNSMLLNGWVNSTDQDWARISVTKIGKMVMIVIYNTTGSNVNLPAFNLPSFCNSVWLTDDNNSGITISDKAVYINKINHHGSIFTYLEV